MKLTGLVAHPMRERVLSRLGGADDVRLKTEYDRVEDELLNLLAPQAALAFGQVTEEMAAPGVNTGAQVLFALKTVGGAISRRSAELFDEGSYTAALLADAIADEALFSLEEQVQQAACGLCSERGFGIARRLEAPEQLPMAAQRECLRATQADGLGIRLTEGLMFDPAKTICEIYLLNDRLGEAHTEHSCAGCSNTACEHRRVPLTVTLENGNTINAQTGETLMQVLRRGGVAPAADCGGRGTCGKCRVRVIKGTVPFSREDSRIFTPRQLGEGWRLACKAVLQEDCTIRLTEEGPMEIIGATQAPTGKRQVLAVDIGTTTLVLQTSDGHSWAAANSQRPWGADVISRIQAANSGAAEQLKHAVCADLKQGIRALAQEGAAAPDEAAIAANTTMLHLLTGDSCAGLAAYPFTPARLGAVRTSLRDLLGEDCPWQCPVTLMPGISAFVGADVTAGLLSCGFAQRHDRPAALLDLGTNGEMAVGTAERLLVTSAAAGPAFEGGAITCGMASLPGAISSVRICNGKAEIQTIGGAPAAGICGSGLLDAAAALLEAGLMDATGLLAEPYFHEGFPLSADGAIRLYQQDIRQLQMAKAAVRAGFDALLRRGGWKEDDVETVFLAGGFGTRLNVEAAVRIGLLPAALARRVHPVGDSALEGARQYALRDDAKRQAEQLAAAAKQVELAGDAEFQESYIGRMEFEKP